MPRVLRLTLIAVAVGGAAWWLAADTVRHYRPESAGSDSIRFAHFGTWQDYETWQRVIGAFEQRYPAVRVKQEYVVGMYGAYNTKLQQQLLSQTLPEAFLVQIRPFTHMADKFADLTELAQDSGIGLDTAMFAPTAIDAFVHEGRLRALPISGGNLLIYCNPDCFARASGHRRREIPLPDDDWKMDDFSATAEALTCDFDGDGKADQFGFWQPRWVYYLPFLWSFGAEVLDSTGQRWLFRGSEAESALAFYQAMRVGQRVSPRPDEVAQMFQDVGFLTGTTAMCVNGPWFQPFLADTRLADRYHVAHIPSGPVGRVTRITWDGICMADGLPPQRRDNAWQFIRFVCSLEAQSILAATQRALPALQSAAASFAEADGGLRSGKFVEALTYSRLQPVTPFFRDVDRAMNRHLADLLNEDAPQSPATCLAGLSSDESITSHFQVASVE